MIISPLAIAANNIVSSRSIKTLKMNKKSDYEKFVKWIDSSNKELQKIKLPRKIDIKKISDFGASGLGFGGAPAGRGGFFGNLLKTLIGAKLLKGGMGAALGLGKGKNQIKLNKGFLNKFFPKYAQERGLNFADPNEAKAARAFSARPGKVQPPLGLPKQSRMPGGRLGGPLSVALAGYDFMQRKGEGQNNVQAGVGAGAGLAGGLGGASLGGKLGLAIGTAIAPGPGTLIGGLLGSLIGGIAGSMGASSLADKATGADKISQRLAEQEAEQKAATGLDFGSVVEKFDKVVTKFEQLSLGLTGVQYMQQNIGQNQQMNPFQEPSQYPPINPSQITYDGPVSGDTFFPLPGGKAGEAADQQFGASRDGGKRSHAGLDMTHHTGDLAAPVAAYKTGKVVESVSNGYNGYVTIDHGGGVKTRYYHTSPSVNVGDVVYGGQQIANLYPDGQNTHLHFEVYRGGSPVDPKSAGLGQNIPAPLAKDKAKQQHEKSIGGTAKSGVNTMQRQQSPEEFFKGTDFGKIFKDPSKRAQFYGEKRKVKNAMVKTPVSDPQVKQAQEMYNSYVRNLIDKKKQDVSSVDTKPEVTPVVGQQLKQFESAMLPTSSQSSGLVIMVPVGGQQQVQPATQSQMIPVPIQSKNQSNQMVATVSESELLNSLWNTLLLTKLSEA